MPMSQLDSENADYDLTSQQTILTHTPTDAAVGLVWIALGDGVKDLDGSGGDFALEISVDGQTVQPAPQYVTFSTAVRAGVFSAAFPIPANAQVLVKLLSPNAADTDVDVTATLFDVGPPLIGTDGGALISEDDQDLAGTLHVDAAAISDSTAAADNVETLAANLYEALIDYREDATSSTDQYSVKWFKDRAAVASGSISDPEIQVIKRSDGADLIAASALSAVGTDGLKYNATGAERNTGGEVLLVKTTATIDAATRTSWAWVGRDK
jgi:hypothetical protein